MSSLSPRWAVLPFLPPVPTDALFPVEGLAALTWWCGELLSVWAGSAAADPWSLRVKLFLSPHVFSLRFSCSNCGAEETVLAPSPAKRPKGAARSTCCWPTGLLPVRPVRQLWH